MATTSPTSRPADRTGAVEPAPGVDVLLVGGLVGDAELVLRAVRDDRVRCVVHRVAAEVRAVPSLRALVRGRASLVLLDAGADRDRATALVAALRQDAVLGVLPVLVVGGFRDRADVDALYRAGASTVVARPTFVDVFVGSLRELLRYWTHVAVLPAVGVAADSTRRLAGGARRR